MDANKTGNRGRGTSTGNWKMKNGNKACQRTGNEVTDRTRVQVRFCFHFLIFSFRVLVVMSLM